MAQRTREELKSFFKANLIPTEENFSDLIDSTVNSPDDFLIRPTGTPPTFHLGGTPTGREKILNFQRKVDETPTWSFELNPGFQEDGTTQGKGFSLTNGLNQTRLFVAESDKGRVGLGTVSPQAQLHIRSTSPVGILGYSDLKAHLSLELGQTTAGGVGSLKLNGLKENQFALLKGGDNSLQLDATGGLYLLNADPGVSSTHPGILQIQNGAGATTVQLHTKGDSYFTGGKVGIGTNNPQEILHVNGNIRGGASGGRLRIQTPSGFTEIGSGNEAWAHILTDRPAFYFDKPVHVDSGQVGSYYTKHLQLRTGNDTRIFANKDTGHVGVATTDPRAPLHVKGTAHFDTGLNSTPLSIGRYNNPDDQVLRIGITDAESVFHYLNDEASSTIRFRLQNTDQERASNKGADANTRDVLRLQSSKAGGFVGINTTSEAPLSVAGTGKTTAPNANLHLSSDVILFGGRNNGKETNSAQISAGLHQADTLCIVGMGASSGARKVKMWAEGGFELSGSLTGNQAGAIKIQSPHGYTIVGPKNTGFTHFETDRPTFYFNQKIQVDSGQIGSYNEHLYLQTANTTRIFANKDNGRVAIGGGTTTSSMLHIGDTGGGTPRTWMNKGVYMGDGSDGMYVGMKLEGSNRADAIIGWGDDANDILRFMYLGSGQPDKEIMNINPNGTANLYGTLNARGIGTQTSIVTSPSDFTLSNRNAWNSHHDWPSLSRTIVLKARTAVLVHYTVSGYGGNSHLICNIRINNVVKTKKITGNETYWGLSDMWMGELDAGTHTIKVTYRTPYGSRLTINNNNDWHDARLNVMVLGENI